VNRQERLRAIQQVHEEWEAEQVGVLEPTQGGLPFETPSQYDEGWADVEATTEAEADLQRRVNQAIR
jgi:hypothetical protein